MFALNFKSVASGVAAVALTFILSWAFVTGTNIELTKRNNTLGFVAAVSALVR